MVIPIGTRMMLFRFSNYKQYSFIDEHLKTIENKGFVWMMKIGKRTNQEKLNAIMGDGGFLILRSPIKDGGKFYICHFTEIKEDTIENYEYVPSYYAEIMDDIDFYGRGYQLFKVLWIKPLPDAYAEYLVLQLNGKRVSEIIKETRTAVMFVKNEKAIELPERA